MLGCFEDILKELISLNSTERKELDDAKKSYRDAVSARKKTEKEKAQEEERQATLVSIKEKMESVKEKVDQIKETIPEINGIRASILGIRQSIAYEVDGRTEVLKSEGDKIIAHISKQIDELIRQINDTVREVKAKKRKATDDLYKEFISCLEKLEAEGLMQNGSFLLKDTVAYKNIIDKDSFKKAEENTRSEDNPKKYHIEFGYGIGNLFSSIGRAWKTRKEPGTIDKTYINIYKYISDNISPIEAEVDTYIKRLISDYQSDIQSLKNDTKSRVDRVLTLVTEKDAAISAMRKKAMEFASNEKSYSEQIKRIEDVREYLDSLISMIGYTQI